MRWKMLREDLIESNAGYRILKRSPTRFHVWGPNGTQDISAIAQATADCLRKYMQRERDPEKLSIQRGRAILGVYDDAQTARSACQNHAQAATG